VINFYTEAVHTVPDGPSAEHAPADKQRSRVINLTEAEFKESPMITVVTSKRTHVTFTILKSMPRPLQQAVSRASRGASKCPISSRHEGLIESTLDTVTHPVGPGCIDFLAPGRFRPASVPRSARTPFLRKPRRDRNDYLFCQRIIHLAQAFFSSISDQR